MEMIGQVTFGICKVCKNNPAVYSRGVCRECEEKRQVVIRELNNKGIEGGTKEFINTLKKEGVYY